MKERQFSPEEITEFQSLWKQQTGEEIDAMKAEKYASELLDLVSLVGGIEKYPCKKPP